MFLRYKSEKQTFKSFLQDLLRKINGQKARARSLASKMVLSIC